MWSKLGDTAWKLGMGRVAGAAYSRAIERARRDHENAVYLPVRAQLMMCQNPQCCWEAQYTQEDPDVLREIYYAYSVHDCPMVIDLFEEDDDDC